jgi:hypothetical protein
MAVVQPASREAFNTPITAGFQHRIPSCCILRNKAAIIRTHSARTHSPPRANQVISQSKRGQTYTWPRHSSRPVNHSSTCQSFTDLSFQSFSILSTIPANNLSRRDMREIVWIECKRQSRDQPNDWNQTDTTSQLA